MLALWIIGFVAVGDHCVVVAEWTWRSLGCHNTWRRGRWWFTVWVRVHRTCSRKEKWRILLHFIGRCLMDSEMKFRDIFHLILTKIRKDITTRSSNRWQSLISAEQMLCLTLRYVGKQATIFNIILLIIQSVITITQNVNIPITWTHQQSWKCWGQIRHLHCFSLRFHSEEVFTLVLVVKESCGYMNQLLGLERTTFEQMTGRVLAEHYRDRNNRTLGNQMKKKKNCEKENPKLSSGFAHLELLLPLAQPADKFSLVFLQLYWEGTA